MSSFSRENLRRHYVEILYVKLHTLVYWKKNNYQVFKIDSFFFFLNKNNLNLYSHLLECCKMGTIAPTEKWN